MAFTRGWDEADAGDFLPGARGDVEYPGIVVVEASISATEPGGGEPGRYDNHGVGVLTGRFCRCTKYMRDPFDEEEARCLEQA